MALQPHLAEQAAIVTQVNTALNILGNNYPLQIGLNSAPYLLIQQQWRSRQSIAGYNIFAHANHNINFDDEANPEDGFAKAAKILIAFINDPQSNLPANLENKFRACTLLGILYLKGGKGLPKDIPAGVHYLQMCVTEDISYSLARRILSYIYYPHDARADEQQAVAADYDAENGLKLLTHELRQMLRPENALVLDDRNKDLQILEFLRTAGIATQRRGDPLIKMLGGNFGVLSGQYVLEKQNPLGPEPRRPLVMAYQRAEQGFQKTFVALKIKQRGIIKPPALKFYERHRKDIKTKYRALINKWQQEEKFTNNQNKELNASWKQTLDEFDKLLIVTLKKHLNHLERLRNKEGINTDGDFEILLNRQISETQTILNLIVQRTSGLEAWHRQALQSGRGLTFNQVLRDRFDLYEYFSRPWIKMLLKLQQSELFELIDQKQLEAEQKAAAEYQHQVAKVFKVQVAQGAVALNIGSIQSGDEPFAISRRRKGIPLLSQCLEREDSYEPINVYQYRSYSVPSAQVDAPAAYLPSNISFADLDNDRAKRKRLAQLNEEFMKNNPARKLAATFGQLIHEMSLDPSAFAPSKVYQFTRDRGLEGYEGKARSVPQVLYEDLDAINALIRDSENKRWWQRQRHATKSLARYIGIPASAVVGLISWLMSYKWVATSTFIYPLYANLTWVNETLTHIEGNLTAEYGVNTSDTGNKLITNTYETDSVFDAHRLTFIIAITVLGLTAMGLSVSQIYRVIEWIVRVPQDFYAVPDEISDPLVRPESVTYNGEEFFVEPTPPIIDDEWRQEKPIYGQQLIPPSPLRQPPNREQQDSSSDLPLDDNRKKDAPDDPARSRRPLDSSLVPRKPKKPKSDTPTTDEEAGEPKNKPVERLALIDSPAGRKPAETIERDTSHRPDEEPGISGSQAEQGSPLPSPRSPKAGKPKDKDSTGSDREEKILLSPLPAPTPKLSMGRAVKSDPESSHRALTSEPRYGEPKPGVANPLHAESVLGEKAGAAKLKKDKSKVSGDTMQKKVKAEHVRIDKKGKRPLHAEGGRKKEEDAVARTVSTAVRNPNPSNLIDDDLSELQVAITAGSASANVEAFRRIEEKSSFLQMAHLFGSDLAPRPTTEESRQPPMLLEEPALAVEHPPQRAQTNQKKPQLYRFFDRNKIGGEQKYSGDWREKFEQSMPEREVEPGQFHRLSDDEDGSQAIRPPRIYGVLFEAPRAPAAKAPAKQPAPAPAPAPVGKGQVGDSSSSGSDSNSGTRKGLSKSSSSSS